MSTKTLTADEFRDVIAGVMKGKILPDALVMETERLLRERDEYRIQANAAIEEARKYKNDGEAKDLRIDNLYMILLQTIRDIAPYAAKHSIDKCFCAVCQQLRRTLTLAAQIVETEQPPVL